MLDSDRLKVKKEKKKKKTGGFVPFVRRFYLLFPSAEFKNPWNVSYGIHDDSKSTTFMIFRFHILVFLLSIGAIISSYDLQIWRAEFPLRFSPQSGERKPTAPRDTKPRALSSRFWQTERYREKPEPASPRVRTKAKTRSSFKHGRLKRRRTSPSTILLWPP